MIKSDARTALLDLGIAPTKALIAAWEKAAIAEESLLDLDRESVAGDGGVACSPVADINPEYAYPSQLSTPTNLRADGQRQGTSNSNLEPVLVEHGTLEKASGKRKAGRPRIIASWFPAVAQTMADGTSLRTALAINRLYLSKSEMRALYRNTTFKGMYQETRRRFLIEHFGRRPTLRARTGRLP
jgi:hypothetical protein